MIPKQIIDVVNAVRRVVENERNPGVKLGSALSDIINPQVKPSVVNSPILGARSKIVPTATKTPTPLPTRTPTPTPSRIVNTKNVQIGKPPSELSNLIRDTFGDESDIAEVVAFTENGGFRHDAINKNKNGSIDLGIFQINSDTFDDFMRRHGDRMRAKGISSYEDMKDPLKNILMAKLIRDEQGWGAWYGPRNRGFVFNL